MSTEMCGLGGNGTKTAHTGSQNDIFTSREGLFERARIPSRETCTGKRSAGSRQNRQRFSGPGLDITSSEQTMPGFELHMPGWTGCYM